jgi:hypothetical protein
MFLYNSVQTRPNRLEDEKNSEYHAKFAKHCLSTLNNYLYRQYINKCLINWSFYKGGEGQWIFDEDIEAFFLDESGDIRNRLKWTKNIIKPMVQQYVGNAIRLVYDAKATCISDFVINEKEKDLAELKAFEQLAELRPYLKDTIKRNLPIGDTPQETEEIFENIWTETYESDINNLIEYISHDVNIDELKVQITRSLALSGLGVYKGYEHNDLYKAECINPLFFIWDMSALKPDLSDAEYMGEWYYMDAPTIFERYPKLTKEERDAIERYGKNDNKGIHKVLNGIFTIKGGKIPVYEMHWKDVDTYEYGWVKDDNDFPYYTMINNPDSKYTDKDLIEPETEKHKQEMGDSKKHKVFRDIERYCIFIPKEEIGSMLGDDIVLEFGVTPFQERNLYDPSNVKFPYKCYTWVYDRGEILTPLDDVIDPQRFLNRTMSVVESHMSNMRGTGTVISKSAVDDRDGEAEVMRNINSSKPIFVDTDRVGSVQNAIGTYGTNLGQGTMQMFQVIDQVQKAIQDVTGVNEAMTGTQGGGDVLVGVIEAQIQRGSLVQEPFYWGITSILRQAYEHMATVGKSVYKDNPRKLSMIVGDKGLMNINIGDNHMLQDFRIFIKRAESREQGIQAGNALLFTLLQAGLIDQTGFANLFGRSNPDMIADSIRKYAKSKLMAQNKMDEVNAQRNQQAQSQQQAQAEMMMQATAADQQQAGVEQEKSHQRELEKIAMKEGLKQQANPQQQTNMQ